MEADGLAKDNNLKESKSNGRESTSTENKKKDAGKVVKDWEKMAALTDRQNEIILLLQGTFIDRPIPPQLEKVKSRTSTGLLEQEIENMQQFYSWFEELGEEKVEEEKYSSRIDTLRTYRDHCDNILTEIDSAFQFLQELENKYNLVSKKTGELHEACEVLVQQQNQLASFAGNISAKLTFFNHLPRVTAELSGASVSVHDAKFKDLLTTLDQSIQFISQNYEFRDSDTYLLKYRQLQNRALSLVKNEIVQTLKQCTTQILQQIKDATETTSADTVYYVKFRTIAPKLRPLCEEIETRAAIKEYGLLLEDCHHAYFQQRRLILFGIVNANLLSFSQQSVDLCDKTRSLLDEFSTALYQIFRPLYIRSQSIEVLCHLIYLLKSEILGDHLESRGKSVETFQPIIFRMIQDIQERLIFMMQTYIRDDIQGFAPTKEDLDYPNKLLSRKNESLKSELEISGEGGWYPTLVRTISCLSNLYLAIDMKIFEGLATEAVDECTLSLLSASKSIAQRSPLDAKMFLIKHLLILRERISTFDITFSFTESALDFSHMKDAFRQILSVPRSLFAFSLENPLLVVVQANIETRDINSKKTLEKELKGGIEALILAITKMTIDPLLSFLAKATAFLSVSAKESSNTSLRTQSFALADKINSLLAEIDKNLQQKLPPLLERICTYITTTSTQAILFKPIKDQILESINQFSAMIQANYTEEDRQIIDLTKIEQLKQILEAKLTNASNNNKNIEMPKVIDTPPEIG